MIKSVPTLSPARIFIDADDFIWFFAEDGEVMFNIKGRVVAWPEDKGAGLIVCRHEYGWDFRIGIMSVVEIDVKGVKTVLFGDSTQEKTEEIYTLLTEKMFNACCDGGGSTVVSWGDIVGTLGDQTDLDTVLDGLDTDLTTAEADIITLQSDMADRLVQSMLTGVISAVVGISTTTYMIFGVTSFGTETTRSGVIPHALTLSNLHVRTTTAQNASGAIVITLRKNGVATALTITIAAGSAAGIFSDTTHSVTFAAGDTLSLEFANAATTNSANFTSISASQGV